MSCPRSCLAVTVLVTTIPLSTIVTTLMNFITIIPSVPCFVAPDCEAGVYGWPWGPCLGPVSGIRSLHPLVTAIPELEICWHNDMLQSSSQQQHIPVVFMVMFQVLSLVRRNDEFLFANMAREFWVATHKTISGTSHNNWTLAPSLAPSWWNILSHVFQ